MITIKLPYITKNTDIIHSHQMNYSKIVHMVYNKAKKEISEKEIRNYVKPFSILDAYLTQCAILEGIALHKSGEDDTVIFGGKSNFVRRCKNLITKEQYRENRLLSIGSQGTESRKGNRKFRLMFPNVIHYLYDKTFIELKLPELHNNYKEILEELYVLSNENKIGITYKLNKEFIWISFDESKLECLKVYKSIKLIENRVLGIDLNPNYIGISVNEINEDEIKVISTKIYDLMALNKSKNSDKVDYELSLICKDIVNISRKYQCSKIAIEELSVKSKDHGKGVGFNRTVNGWKRNYLINLLKKRCNLANIKLIDVNPIYTSFIGNMLHDYPDMVSSSVEIARRGYFKFIKGKFYPKYDNNILVHRWKEMAGIVCCNWIELYKEIKKSGMRYRHPLPLNGVYEFITKKSLVNCY